jgi:lipid II:glycine glycyltransferase (peptidoglycan interpeptide bridge formation enzyme)
LIHLFQNREWCEDLLSSGEIPSVLELRSGGYALVISKKYRFLPFRYLRVPFGPVIDFHDFEKLECMLDELKHLAIAQGAVHIEFNPYVWDIDIPSYHIALARHGFRKFPDHVYRHSFVIDLTQTEHQIFKNFDRRGQKAIRQAQDRGVRVEQVPINESSFSVFYALYKNTCLRTSFIPESEQLLKKQLLFWGDRNKAFLFSAYIGVETVGALVLFDNSDGVSTLYQGNNYDPDFINRRPSNAMYWESLKWARQKGYRIYDFGGVTIQDNDHESDEKKQGIYGFKKQFGGALIYLPGNFGFINRPMLHKVLSFILPAYSKLALNLARMRNR